MQAFHEGSDDASCKTGPIGRTNIRGSNVYLCGQRLQRYIVMSNLQRAVKQINRLTTMQNI